MYRLHERSDFDVAENAAAFDDWQRFGPTRHAAGAGRPTAITNGVVAAPDVPAEVGAMIAATFAAIMLAFALLFAASDLATMIIAIGIGFTTIFVAVPAIFLKIESAHARRISHAAFLEKGLRTWTGHLTAREG
jgi:hypothetical protein